MNEFTLTKAFIEFASKGDPAKIVDQALQKTQAMRQAASSPEFGKLAKQYAEATKEQDKIIKNLSGIAQKEQEAAAKQKAIELAKAAEEKAETREQKIRKAGHVAAAGMAATDAFIYSTVGQAAPVVMEQLNRAFNDLQAVVGQTLIPYVESLTQKVRGLADWILNLDDGTRETVGKVIGLVSVLFTLGVAASLLYKVFAVVGPLIAGAAAFMGPVGLALAGVAAAIGLIYYFSKGDAEEKKKKDAFSEPTDERSAIAKEIAEQQIKQEIDARSKQNKQFLADNPDVQRKMRDLENALQSRKDDQGLARQPAGAGGPFRGLPPQLLRDMMLSERNKLPFPQGVTAEDKEKFFQSSMGLAATAQTAIMAPEDLINKLQLEALKQKGPEERAAKAGEEGAKLLENIRDEMRDLNDNIGKVLDAQGLGD